MLYKFTLDLYVLKSLFLNVFVNEYSYHLPHRGDFAHFLPFNIHCIHNNKEKYTKFVAYYGSRLLILGT